MALSYAFDPSKGETAESTRRKRRIVEALLGQTQRTPRSIGEGLHHLGANLAAALIGRQADQAEAAGRSSARADIERIAPLFPAAPSDPNLGQAEADGGNLGRPGSMSGYRDAVASIESAGSGDYSAVGPTHSKMGRALGRYQVMESNIGPWSKEALGREITADEFLANPDLQDAIFDAKFGSYVQQFGPEGAAQAWFAGPGGVGKTNRKDSLGTNVGQYGARFMRSLGKDRLEGGVGSDPIGGVQGIYDGEPYQPGNAVTEDQLRQVEDAPMNYRTLPTQNVPPTDAGMESPANRAIVQALISQNPMGRPQRLQSPNMSPGLQRVAEALLPRQAAQQPVQVAQAQGLPEMAGNSQWSGPSINELLRASSNEWLSDSERGAVNRILEQQQRRQQMDYQREQEMADPRYQLGLEADRLALDKGRYEMDQARRKRNLVETKDGIYDADTGEWITNPNAPAEGNEFGLTPQLMQDKDGNYFYAQPTKDGRILRSEVEDGAIPVNPYEKSFQSSKGRKEGELLGEATASLPEKIATADYSIGLIDDMLTHPGRETATGLSGTIDPRNYFAGTDATDFNIRRKQIEGRTFLEAFNSLRGGGQITEAEGQKATIAMARLDAAQSDEQFFTALEELKELLNLGKERAIAKVQAGGNGMPSAGSTGGSVPAAAVDMLRSDPSLAEQFDLKYGVGAAARILGGQ